MIIRLPREFRLRSMPATVQLFDEDIFELAEPFPAEVILGSEYAEVSFASPRAAVDFVEALHGFIPFTATEMSEDEELIFNDPELRAGANGDSDSLEPRFETADRIARRWAIAGFSVAASGTVIALGALVVAIIALVG